ncbi:hypothetical protein HYDPIDRAFT_111077 [Hydnomerulius pinastri MD-312]|uniref:F-box domain-containing protein n=1 Tax=Hydnomerulius pinastri MD-312 TaxID=994086 RepID=A0A0C9VHS4_9AGAM|nr:hypothetical protein HYDPIDRAFT_111077 [Hydnomerulius pinastri MD-312]
MHHDSDPHWQNRSPALFSTLPVELLHQLAGFLDIPDILTLRQTCKYFFALSKDRSLWIALFNRLREEQPLPCSRSELGAMSVTEIERALWMALKVEKSFLVPRECTQSIDDSGKHGVRGSLSGLSFVLDRYLLSADNTMVISLWDITELSSSPTGISYPCARLSLPSWVLLAHTLSFDKSTLYVAVSRHDRARIYTVPLETIAPTTNKYRLSFNLAADFNMQLPDAIRCINPESNLALLYNTATSIDVLNWQTNCRATISIQPNGHEEVWNGVLTLQFCGPYILCFRVHSVEAYPLPLGFLGPTAATLGALSMLQHRFTAVNFRRASLSHTRLSQNSAGEVYTIFVLSNDVFRGTFHYQITVKIKPVPSISVRSLALQGLGISDSHLPRKETGSHMPSDVSRTDAFVSAWALGSVGLRGVWVDRKRGSIDRRVVAFTTHPSRLRSYELPSPEGNEDEADEFIANVPRFSGNAILAISSYDLQDDITICAVSEYSGHIALGARSGAISLI